MPTRVAFGTLSLVEYNLGRQVTHRQAQHITDLQQQAAKALAEATLATSTVTWADPAVPPSLVIPPPVTTAVEHPAHPAQEQVMEMELDPVPGQAPVPGDILMTADRQEVVIPEGVEVIITQSASGTKYAKLIDKAQAPVEPQAPAPAPTTMAEELLNMLTEEQSVGPSAEKEAESVDTENTMMTEESSDESEAAKIQRRSGSPIHLPSPPQGKSEEGVMNAESMTV